MIFPNILPWNIGDVHFAEKIHGDIALILNGIALQRILSFVFLEKISQGPCKDRNAYRHVGDIHFSHWIHGDLTLTLPNEVFLYIFPGNIDKAGSKSQHLSKYIDVLWIHWPCPFCSLNSWSPNYNPKWIFPAMVFSHVFYQYVFYFIAVSKSQRPPKHTDALWILRLYLFCCLNSWSPNTNPKGICPWMLFFPFIFPGNLDKAGSKSEHPPKHTMAQGQCSGSMAKMLVCWLEKWQLRFGTRMPCDRVIFCSSSTSCQCSSLKSCKC